jgi:hypothetical protein
MKLYMFQTVRLSIIRSLFTVHRFLNIFLAVPSWSCSTAVYKPVWHVSLLNVQWINAWWWTNELSKKCRVSWQNKFVKLVHLVGFFKEIWDQCEWNHLCPTADMTDNAQRYEICCVLLPMFTAATTFKLLWKCCITVCVDVIPILVSNHMSKFCFLS